MNKIEEGNKIIAEYMGFYVTEFNGKYHFVCEEKKKPEHRNQAWKFRLEEAQYHSSWDWLMPVVEKIEGMEHSNGFNFCFDIVSRSAVEITAGDESIVFIQNSGIGIASNVKMKNIYEAVIEFINWYNNNK